jgi:nitronate monooxygenase
MDDLLTQLGIRLPIVQAPMAGGPDTPELAAAVTEAGGLGSIGCAYLAAEQIDAVAAKVRILTTRPFGLNLFVRTDAPADAAAAARVAPVLAEFRRELGLSAEPAPPKSPPAFEAQFAAVLRARPRVFSFTFGVPTGEQIAALRAAGIVVVGTATSLEEANVLAERDVDVICAQGCEAGGHRGTFLGRPEDSLVGTMALTRQIAVRVAKPVIAAGGIMDGAGVRAALDLGARAAQLGTAFMLCPEAGTHGSHRAALKSDAARTTVVTRAFSGRAARGIRNRFTDALENIAPAPFPQQQELTAELRAEAAKSARPDLMQLWAGQGTALLRELPAAALVRALAAEAGLG